MNIWHYAEITKGEKHMKKILIMMLIALLPFLLFANGAKEAEQVQDDTNETLELVLMTKDSTASGFKDWISLV